MSPAQFVGARLDVVESGAGPALVCVADGAICQESESRVRRVDSGVVVLLVAGKAFG